jgi:hypothetical protein
VSESQTEWKQFLQQYGYYAMSFTLKASNAPTLIELQEWMRADEPKFTGWTPFWWPTRMGIAPQVVNQSTYECVHDGSGPTGRIERWRASTTGQFAIVRAHDMDRESPGSYLELTLPVWRVAELLLYAGRMAARFGSDTVDVVLRYEALSGRFLSARASPNRVLSGEYTTAAKRYERRVVLVTEDIDTGIVEMTDGLVRGLFGLFQFALPAALCEQEISRMRSHRF